MILLAEQAIFRKAFYQFYIQMLLYLDITYTTQIVVCRLMFSMDLQNLSLCVRLQQIGCGNLKKKKFILKASIYK